jgi:acyl carrier protein
MENQATYDGVFLECLTLENGHILSKLEYNSIPEWDSVGHMTLIAGIEEAFDIVLEMDDIIDFSSYTFGKSILAKYDVVI